MILRLEYPICGISIPLGTSLQFHRQNPSVFLSMTMFWVILEIFTPTVREAGTPHRQPRYIEADPLPTSFTLGKGQLNRHTRRARARAPASQYHTCLVACLLSKMTKHRLREKGS